MKMSLLRQMSDKKGQAHIPCHAMHACKRGSRHETRRDVCGISFGGKSLASFSRDNIEVHGIRQLNERQGSPAISSVLTRHSRTSERSTKVGSSAEPGRRNPLGQASSFPCCLEQPCFNYIICGCLTSPLLHLSLKAGAYDATHNGSNLLWGLNGRNLQIPHGDYVLCHPSQQRRNIGHGSNKFPLRAYINPSSGCDNSAIAEMDSR
ncbi:predicted protein [Histoplasma capsulatum var. duboisii H88]|uniref:Predicted protein n=1 Tax=Ajellomyces capsulatus (strain H88) TaxID=544711 RepID=F0UCJ7_AJEC8|nr:predicted protein [Histoplasma capsulatum var. duboisii H88]